MISDKVFLEIDDFTITPFRRPLDQDVEFSHILVQCWFYTKGGKKILAQFATACVITRREQIEEDNKKEKPVLDLKTRKMIEVVEAHKRFLISLTEGKRIGFKGYRGYFSAKRIEKFK